MKTFEVIVHWPNGKYSIVSPGTEWLKIAKEAGVDIPTGCLGGSCGACEIEVNGEIVRACINCVPISCKKELKVEFSNDPYW